MPEPWYLEAELTCVNAFRELADKVHYEGGQVRSGGTAEHIHHGKGTQPMPTST